MGKSKIFDHIEIEAKWRKVWEDKGVYRVEMERAEKPFYNLWMFPYPSAEGLHAGHAFSTTGSDVYGRLKRMMGFDVFQPIGYDSFGIHSENYAIKIGSHPAKLIPELCGRYKKQLERMGHGYDWSRTVTTSDIEYYRWTQWVFVKMWEAGLVERKKARVNWCPSCKTVLADEQVIGGECERCSSEVTQKDLEQWFFKMATGKRSNGKLYVESLLENIEKLDWSETIKTSQRNWIGKKEGAKVRFMIYAMPAGRQDLRFKIEAEVFTTRIDTLFGVTFVVVAPEVAKQWTEQGWKPSQEVDEYVEKALRKTQQVRKVEEKEKTGVKTDLMAVNPASGEKVPVFVADYVLMEVGTGVVMGVPGHDSRDLEFAKKYGLEVRCVVSSGSGIVKRPCLPAGRDSSPELNSGLVPSSARGTTLGMTGGEVGMTEGGEKKEVWEGEGKLVESGNYTMMESVEAREKMIEDGLGVFETHYHLRDWVISRQRYWGAPVPMIFCEKCQWQVVPEKDLPVELPYLENFKPTGTGEAPLAQLSGFVKTKCSKCDGEARRETDVCDVFLDSSWYYLRYPSVGIDDRAFDSEITKKWLPVARYIGGAEHANLHLLYSRFVTMAFHDMGILSFEEPFASFRAHGLLIKDGHKMSKSKGNVISPDALLERYGADTLRCYLMFIGPLEKSADFREAGVAGMYRWLSKVWEMFNDETKMGEETSLKLKKRLNRAVKEVSEDIESLKYNTALSSLMEVVNVWKEEGEVMGQKEGMVFLKLLAPLAPHMTEELYQGLVSNGEFQSIHKSSWPTYDPSLSRDDQVTVVVQVNGKMRAALVVEREAAGDQKTIEGLARGDERVVKWLGEVKKVVFVPGRLINFVV